MRRLERGLLVLAAVPFGIGAAVGVGSADTESGGVVLTFADDRIIESSGLVARDGLVVTTNDSGDTHRVFSVDADSGETVGLTEWPGEAEDVEALAPAGRGAVWVADIGDNAASRDEVELARVPVGRGDRVADPTTYRLTYADGPHDAETLLVHPRTGRAYVVAKEFIGRLYAAPEHLSADGPNVLQPMGDVLGIATDGAFFPDGRHLVLRNYGQAAFYTWPGLERVGVVDLPRQPQGEGIAVTPRGEVLVSSEGAHTDVLRVALPAALRAELDGADPGGSSAGPSTASASSSATAEEDGNLAGDESGTGSWLGIGLSPWAVGGVAALLVLLLLLRSLRPR